MKFAPIAIVGQACILPGALDPAQLWELVLAGGDLVTSVPEGRWRLDPGSVLTTPGAKKPDRTWSDRGGYVRGFAERFDAEGFLLPAEEISRLDPATQWVLHGVREALAGAGVATPLPADGPKTGLVLGNLSYPTPGLVAFAESVWFDGQPQDVPHPPAGEAPPAAANRFSSGLPAHLAAQALNLQGDAFALDAACASSLYAIKLACDRLQARRCDLMVAGAVNRTDDLFIHIGFTALQALSRRGESRPFAADADGLLPAEGAAFVVLKRLADAVADGDEILGVIRGVGLSNDGNSGGFLSPSADGQVRAMQAAYAMAGLTPADISLLECHATGTPIGDATELASAGQLFAGCTNVPIGSLKANLGHLITAAGAAGLIKLLAALRAGIRPPSRPVATPLAALEESPFRLLQAPEDWPRQAGIPRRAALSAFGFGGNNAHLIVEEWLPETVYPQPAAPAPPAIALIDLEISAGPFADRDAFVQALLEGRSGSRMETIELAMAGLRFPPKDLQQTLPQQLLVLEVARTLAARHPHLPGASTAVLVGMGCDPEIARYGLRWRLDEWAKQWAAAGEPVTAEWVAAARTAVIPPLEAAGVVGTMPNIPANRINTQLNYLGPSHTLSGEELSGLRALECAIDALQRGEIDAALVAAVDLSQEPVHAAAAAQLMDAQLAAGDRQNGGDAAVVLLLQRAEDAARAGNAVLALLTPANPTELDGPSAAGEAHQDAPPLALGLAAGYTALTAQFGHAHAAAGLLHVAAAALCLRHGLHLSPAGAAGVGAAGARPATPWLAAARTAQVRIDALGGQSAALILTAAQPAVAPPLGDIPQLFLFGGTDAAAVQTAMAQNEQSSTGPARLAIIATAAELPAQRQAAGALLARLASGGGVQLLGKGIYWSPAPLAGELGFVFTPAAAAYGGMGRELLLALPALGEAVVRKFPCLARTQAWLAEVSAPSDPFALLQGCALLSQAHAILSQDVLGLRPDAFLGVSSGETNSLFASGAWHDMDAMFAEIEQAGMYSREIAGEYRVAARVWQVEPQRVEWAGWRVLAPVAEVQAALQDEPLAYLTMINAPADCLVAGQADACARVVAQIGPARCRQNEGEIIAHHPILKNWESEWRAIHSRATQPVPGVRFYANAHGASYTPDQASAAEALTGQATAGVDFRRVVEAAYADGVRIFVEHGPRNVCSGWIRAILGERPHLAVALDRPQNGVSQLLAAAAQLLLAGVPLDIAALNCALGAANRLPTAVPAPQRLTFPAHYPPLRLPPLPAHKEQTAMPTQFQQMPPPPPLPPVNLADGPRRTAPVAPAAPVVASAPAAPSVPVAIAVSPAMAAAPPITALPAPSLPQPLVRRTETEQPAPYVAAPAVHAMAGQLAAFHSTVAAAHQQFLAQQARALRRLLELRGMVGEALPAQAAAAPQLVAPALPAPQHFAAPLPALQVPAPQVPAPQVPAPPAPAPVTHTPPVLALPVSAPVGGPRRDAYPGPHLDRRQLEALASGKISAVLGPIFARQDDFPRQVRMPMPPLLLADRVLGIDAEAGAVGQKGVIWTETDILPDAWYLHAGHMPAGVLIEAGQADLLLVSYLGADFVNQGERVYRLLGCEATFHAPLPSVGDTLHYVIHLDGYAQQGPVRLFFFHYDCYSGDRRIFSVRNGQAGFFTDAELANSHGVIWDARTAEHAAVARVDAPAVAVERTRFSAEQVAAFAAGRVVDCFGPGFAAAQVHVRTPTIAGGRMLLFDKVVELTPGGGPWGRGYLRAEDHIHPDEWFFAGHFKNDPCMPGTMMLEGCLQTMAFYMAALGYTLNHDGWRFEPAQEEMYKLVCRGQVTPAAKTVVYELFVEELVDGPIPTLYADLLCTVDGLAAFHCRRMGLRLVPAFPLAARQALLAGPELADPALVDSVDPAAGYAGAGRPAQTLGHTYDAASIAACAWGAPSAAFGERFARFDGPARCPRLPGPPYLFMTRVTHIEAPPGAPDGAPVAGGSIVAEYQIPPDAWYFAENGCRTMPYAVLLEAALQPCGWFASYKGSVLATEEELYFRNLDGTATQTGEVLPQAGLLRTHVTNTTLARLGSMTIAGFDVACFVGDVPVFQMTTTFGFFPQAALASQAGLPADAARRQRLQEPSSFRCELGQRPPRYCAGALALPGPMLLLLDRISGFWPQGGEAQLGRLRAEIDVDAQDWFFQSHFMGDSVQPGSLGLEAMLQALQFYMLETGMGEGIDGAHFEPIQLNAAMTWKYRGQVMPSAQRVTIELEITDKGGVAGQDAYTQAAASLWVDGLRIYEAAPVAMRIVADPARAHAPGDERLNPAVDSWLNDHCPTWTIPALAMMSMADRLAAGAARRAPGRKVIGLRNLRVHRWLAFGQGNNGQPVDGQPGAQTIRVVGAPYGSDSVSMQLLNWDAGRSLYTTVASGEVVVGEHWQLAPAAWPPPADAQVEPDPYAAGVLFHGPAYHLLAELRLGAGGASYWLDLDASGVPLGLLNQGLLDAATHGIPHDALWRWSDEIGRDVAAYPVAIPSAAFYGPAPTQGRVRCEGRFGGFRGGDRQFPLVHLQIICDDKVWAEVTLVEMLLPKGPLGQADPLARRAFLHDRLYTPGLSLSQFDGIATTLSVAQVQASDWLPGTVAAIYGLEAAAPAQLAQAVAIRDHAAQRLHVHPSEIVVQMADAPDGDLDGEPANGPQNESGGQLVRAAAASRPLNVQRLRLLPYEGGWQVTDQPDREQGALDVSGVRAFWRSRAQAGDTLVEDLTLALMRRFVGSVDLVDPAGFAALQGQGLLYLANHQLDLESALFVSLLASLQGTITTAIARQDLGESWIGPFFDICFQHPQIIDPHMLLLIDRSSPEAVLQTLAAAVQAAATRANSLLVHVEGRHALQARRPVEMVSSSLIDLAVAHGVPIVPVRFAGGLPLAPVAEPLAFPTGYGRQEIWIGAPLLPAALAGLSSAARKEAVLAALNGFGGRWRDETPAAGDPAFAAAVAAWQAARGVNPVQAVLWQTLAAAPALSRESRLLQALVRGEQPDLTGLDAPRRRWLAHAAHGLFGLEMDGG